MSIEMIILGVRRSSFCFGQRNVSLRPTQMRFSQWMFCVLVFTSALIVGSVSEENRWDFERTALYDMSSLDFHTILDESKFVWTEWLWMVIFLVIWARPVQKVPKLVGGVTQSKAADFALLPSIFCVVKRTQPQVTRYPPPPEDRIFPPGENLPPLWEPLRYAHKR